MTGAARLRGRGLDARRHHAVEGPRLRGRGPARAHRRAARALLAPPARSRDRPRGPAEAARREGAAARRRRARLARRALPRRGRRRHDRHRRQRRRRPLQPAAPGRPLERPHRRAQGRLGRDRDPRDQPGRERREAPGPARRRQHHGDHRGLRRDRRRPRQLPHALPAERRQRAAADPGGVGVDPRLRGPAVGLPPLRGPLLPLPLPDAAAGRAGTVLRRRRRARRAARRDGPAPVGRGDQAGHGRRRPDGRPPAALRRARHDLHRAEGAPRPGLPDLLARPGVDLGRGDGRLPGLRELVLRRRPAERR